MGKSNNANEKTNAMRELENIGIAYNFFAYGEDVTDATKVAEVCGFDAETVFKTLVTVGKSGNHYVFMMPANAHLDLKKAALAAGEKNIEMIAMKELLPLTGYIHGGCSPFGMKKKFKTFIDETVILWDEFSFSAGKVGRQVRVKTAEFLEKSGIETKDLSM